MMNKPFITGASQRVSQNGKSEWQALYVCHKCGEEFALSSEFCKDEKTAREESRIAFDIQQRKYCYRCGYPQLSSESIPESIYISELNNQIDILECKRRELLEEITVLKNCFNGQPEEIKIALAKGWITMTDYLDDDEVTICR